MARAEPVPPHCWVLCQQGQEAPSLVHGQQAALRRHNLCLLVPLPKILSQGLRKGQIAHTFAVDGAQGCTAARHGNEAMQLVLLAVATDLTHLQVKDWQVGWLHRSVRSVYGASMPCSLSACNPRYVDWLCSTSELLQAALGDPARPWPDGKGLAHLRKCHRNAGLPSLLCGPCQAWPAPCSPAGPAKTFNGLPPAAPAAVPATHQQACAV